MTDENNSFGIITKHYFAGVKFCYALVVAVYIIINGEYSMKSSAIILITVICCTAIMGIYEITKNKLPLLISELAVVICATIFLSNEFIILLPAVISDLLVKFNLQWYMLFSPLICIVFAQNKYIFVMLCFMTAIIYYQHYGIIKNYRKSTEDYEKQELQLKNSIDHSAEKFRNEIHKTNLYYENMILQDKARLSQELHDKLGHRINGSIYQLEACRVLSSDDPEKAEKILQRVIESLRTGMDEIRALLRRERPENRKITLFQLESLCHDCKEQYGIDAQLKLSGNSEQIDDKIWKVVLDNSCEAITNSLKYSKCSKISIEIAVLNKLLRCCISDNGKGCENISDGMGIQGMKQRIEKLGGVINIDGMSGFTINMLIPINKDE